MINLDTIKKKKVLLENELAGWLSILEKAPEGKLVSRKKKNGKYEYTCSIKSPEGKKQEIYIPQSDYQLAANLALKPYAELRIRECRKELGLFHDILQFYEQERPSGNYLKTHPGASELILPAIYTADERVRKWQEAEYVRSTKHLEDLKYPTVIKGLLVRSKAEADIISRLVYYGVPFRYEEQVIIDGIVYHPDITCLNVRTFEIVYFEHQGAWDKEDYVRDQAERMVKFSKVGIIPWKNLIITTETAEQPLDINWVDEIIQYYLL